MCIPKRGPRTYNAIAPALSRSTNKSAIDPPPRTSWTQAIWELDEEEEFYWKDREFELNGEEDDEPEDIQESQAETQADLVLLFHTLMITVTGRRNAAAA